MGNNRKWLVPDYFDAFSCKCGSCRNACCKGWKIAVTQEEYYRLIGLECSETLHEKIESSFVKIDFGAPDKFAHIVPDWRGQCRMLGDDGLCMIQKECGEEMIPETCRVYPRSLKNINDNREAVCSASCEAVVEMLISKDRLEFCFKEMDEKYKPEITETLPLNPERLWLSSRDILQDRNKSLYDRIISLGRLLSVDKTGEISLDILLNILEKLLETSDTLREYASDVFGRYRGCVGDAERLYADDFDAFKKNYPKWEVYFENLLINNLVYSSFPYCDNRITKKEAFYGVLIQYELLRLICTVYTRNKPDKEKLVDCIAAVYHLVEHTAFYYNVYSLWYTYMNI